MEIIGRRWTMIYSLAGSLPGHGTDGDGASGGVGRDGGDESPAR